MKRALDLLPALAGFALAVLSVGARAEGHGAGNGGNAYVCFKTVATKDAVEAVMRGNRAHPETPDYPLTPTVLAEIDGKVRLLDLVEQAFASLGGEAPALVRSNAPYEEILRDRIRLLARRNAVGSDLAEALDARLPLERFRFSSAGVVTIDDSEHAFVPAPRCLVVQVAVQKDVGSETSVTIDRNLFDRMENLDRAALVSHELFVFLEKRNLALLGATESPSPAARKLNQLLYERRLETADGWNLAFEIENLDPFYAMTGVEIPIPREDGAVRTAIVLATGRRNPETLERDTTTFVLKEGRFEIGPEFRIRVPEGTPILRLRRSPRPYVAAGDAPILLEFRGETLKLGDWSYDETSDTIEVDVRSAGTLLGFPIAAAQGGYDSTLFARANEPNARFSLRRFRAGRDFARDGFRVRAGQTVELDSAGRITAVSESVRKELAHINP